MPIAQGLLALALAAFPPLDDALARAGESAGVRFAVDEGSLRLPAGCAAESVELLGAPRWSQRAVLEVHGRDERGAACVTRAFAFVRVYAPLVIARRDVAPGEQLDGSYTVETTEVTAPARWLRAVPAGGRALRRLQRGRPIDEGAVQAAGPLPGEAIKVAVTTGGLEISAMGTVVPCRTRGAVCARLLNGRRVEGALQGDVVVVELP